MWSSPTRPVPCDNNVGDNAKQKAVQSLKKVAGVVSMIKFSTLSVNIYRNGRETTRWKQESSGAGFLKEHVPFICVFSIDKTKLWWGILTQLQRVLY